MIRFTKVTYKNFFSAGNIPIEIDLCKSHLNLISGKNGTGKSSSVTDSLCFALYGKPYRNINKPQVINSVNQKHCLVTVDFDIGKKKYHIKRGLKPSIFEIYENDVLVNQSPNSKDYQKVLEQQILKMNYRAFTQIVIMGSGAYVPFMELTPQHRREFIEDLLDIKIFSVMGKLMSEKVKLSKDVLKDIDSDMKLLKEKAILQESFIKKQKTERRNNIDQLEKEHADLMVQVENDRSCVFKIMEDISSLESESQKYDVSEELSDLKIKQRQVEKDLNKAQEEKTYYETLVECPTCGQGIKDDHRKNIVSSSVSRISDLQVEMEQVRTSFNIVNDTLKVYESLNEKIFGLNKQVSELNRKVYADNLVISKIQKSIDELVEDTGSVDEETAKLKDYAKKIVALDKQKRSIIEDQYYQNIASQLLQDTGIKAKIVKQYIPIINKLVNKYLGVLDFFCQFNLDENFNETVKSRYRDEFTYHSFSEGQKARINMALIFTWREIARLKNSINTNITVFDELLDSSVDGSGMEMAMTLLDGMKDSNIFVISHRDGIADKFPNVITFDMKNNFSFVKE